MSKKSRPNFGRYEGGKKYKYDEIKVEDTRLPEDAKEEAIMLIGGINICFGIVYI